LQGDPTWTAVVYIVMKALLAIFLWGCAAIGYLWTPLKVIERVCAAGIAVLLVAALPITDEIGFTLGTLFVVWNLWRRYKAQ